ncbi:hypothetical protein ABK040_015081 [Willaertia magna]
MLGDSETLPPSPTSSVNEEEENEEMNQNEIPSLSTTLPSSSTSNNHTTTFKRSDGHMHTFVKLFDLGPSILQNIHSPNLSISCVKISPNGALLATGSSDGSIIIWEIMDKGSPNDQNNTNNTIITANNNNQQQIISFHLKEPTKLITFKGHTLGINDISWSNDSNYICSCSDDKTIKIWNVISGECLKNLIGHNHFVFAVAYSPQNNLIASGGFDETVRLWDVRSGKCLKTLPAHSDPITSIQFSRDGSLLTTSSYDGFCRIWDTTTGQCLRTILSESDNPPLAFSKFSPNSSYIVTCAMESKERPAIVTLWSFRPNVKEIQTYKGHFNSKYCLSFTFHYKENWFIGASEDGFVYIWDVQTGNVVTKLNANNNNHHLNKMYPVLGVDCSPTVDYIVAFTNEPRLVFWRGKKYNNSPTAEQ